MGRDLGRVAHVVTTSSLLRLSILKGDRWLAYNVKIEGISLVTNYRSSFARLIRQKGIGGVIRELRVMNHARASEVGKQVAANNGP